MQMNDIAIVIDSHQWVVTILVSVASLLVTGISNADYPGKRQTILSDIKIYNEWKDVGDWRALSFLRCSIDDEIKHKYADANIQPTVVRMIIYFLLNIPSAISDVAQGYYFAAVFTMACFAVCVGAELYAYRKHAAYMRRRYESLEDLPDGLELGLRHCVREILVEARNNAREGSDAEADELLVEGCRRLSKTLAPTNQEFQTMVFNKMLAMSAEASVELPDDG